MDEHRGQKMGGDLVLSKAASPSSVRSTDRPGFLIGPQPKYPEGMSYDPLAAGATPCLQLRPTPDLALFAVNIDHSKVPLAHVNGRSVYPAR